MFAVLIKILAYLALPFAVGQYVFRPLAYTLVNLFPGLGLKSLLLAAYLLITVALIGFMAFELWRQTRGRQRWGAALTALAMLALNPYEFVWRDGLLLTDLRQVEQINLDPADYQVRVQGTDLVLNGTVSIGMWQQVRRTLAENPNIRQVRLASPGGQVSPAIAMADQFRALGLSTYTNSRCFSACTLLFLSGQERTLGPYAQLGFHAAYRLDAGGNRIASGSINRALIERFVRQGVDPDFSLRAWSTPSDHLWLPDADRLLRSGYATKRA